MIELLSEAKAEVEVIEKDLDDEEEIKVYNTFLF